MSEAGVPDTHDFRVTGWWSGSLVAKSRAFLAKGPVEMNRLAAALIAYAVIAVLTYLTITDHTIRGITFAILALFAVKSVLRRKDVMHPGKGE